MSEEEIVNKWFEENMCVSFDKFIENWEEQQEFTKHLEQEVTKLKGVIETYEILIKANNINNWNELKTWLEEVIKDIDEARNSYEKYSLFEERLRSKYFAYNNTLMKMQGLENKQCHTTSE